MKFTNITFQYNALLLVFRISDIIAWHAYSFSNLKSNESNCDDYKGSSKFNGIREDNPYHLWPNINNEKEIYSNNGSLFGFNEAMDIIWRNQHPENCSTAKFMISYGWPGGFGSMVHVEGVTLAIAIELGRVLLPHPDGPIRGWPRDFGLHVDQGWQVDVPYCQHRNLSTMECYYEPWSSCSYNDAFKGRYKNMNRVPDIWIGDFEREQMFLNGNLTLPRRMRKRAAGHRTIIFINFGKSLPFVPAAVMPILSCSPMQPHFRYYWWRAVSATYFLRPNSDTLQEIKKYQTLPISQDETCIAMHVRRGDKEIEMKLVPLESYLNTAKYIWDSNLVPKRPGQIKPVLFLGSDEPSVFSDTVKWGEKNGWKIIFTNLFDRNNVSAKLGFEALEVAMVNGTTAHNDLEYLSMIVNLDYALRCDAWVCTLASNTCRVIDELRTTIAGKANRVFADLSTETCSHPPCIDGKNIIDFSWRR